MFTRTRYVSYVNTYTAVQSGDFYFGSNILGAEEDGITYTVSQWNGQSYDITVSIQNYVNSYLYNTTGTDFYYHVWGEMYQENEEGELEINTIFKSSVSYPSNAETVTINGTTYAKVEGTPIYDTDSSQSVTVSMYGSQTVSTEQIFMIYAETVPVLPESEDTEGSEAVAIANEYTGEGIYHSVLQGKFILQENIADAVYSTVIKQSDASAEVQLKITCTDIQGADSVKLRIYFNNEKLKEDNMTLSSVTVVTDSDGNATSMSYADVTVQSNNLLTILFFKTGSSSVIGSDDLYVTENLN